jgi:hypothetical protein
MRDRAFLGYNHDALDHGWRLATRDAEEARHANASAELQAALNQTVMDELRDWLRDSGACARRGAGQREGNEGCRFP